MKNTYYMIGIIIIGIMGSELAREKGILFKDNVPKVVKEVKLLPVGAESIKLEKAVVSISSKVFLDNNSDLNQVNFSFERGNEVVKAVGYGTISVATNSFLLNRIVIEREENESSGSNMRNDMEEQKTILSLKSFGIPGELITEKINGNTVIALSIKKGEKFYFVSHTDAHNIAILRGKEIRKRLEK